MSAIAIEDKIVTINVSEIKPYKQNAKKHPENQIKKIMESITEYGFNVPLVIGLENEIVCGHGRYLAAKKLGLEELPCIVKDDLTPEQIKAFRIADNKVTESAWDFAFLKTEFDELKSKGFNLDLTGFSVEEIDGVIGEDGSYTKKVDTPIYEITGEKPGLKDLFDDSKEMELLAEIKKADIPKGDKSLLIKAAQRHCVFNYDKIAEYYAHAGRETQRLMEKSALVIIDFNKAIEYGYVKIKDEIAKQYGATYDND